MVTPSVPVFRFITEVDQGRNDVRGFQCGTERWDVEVAEALRDGSAVRAPKPPKQVTFLYIENGGRGQLIGFFNYVRKTRRPLGEPLSVLHIPWFGVAIGFQGHGHGQRMMNAIFDDAKASAAAMVDLYVHSENTRAIGFYEKLGFEYVAGADHFEESDRYHMMVRVLD